MQTVRSTCVWLLPAVMFLSTIAASAQRSDALDGEKSPGATAPIAGQVRVKLTRVAADRGVTPSLFGAIGAELGVTGITGWLNAELLRYSDPQKGMYMKGAGRFESTARSLERIVIVTYDASIDPVAAASLLATSPSVEYAEAVWPRTTASTPNDPDISNGKQWHLDMIQAPLAWDIVKGDSSIVIAVTDTGIEPINADLQEVLWRNPGESGEKSANGEDDDNNGLVDDWWGYDFGGADGYTPDNDPSPGLDEHGTHVAGIAGASGDNQTGGAGVAYGVEIMAIKIGGDTRNPKLTAAFSGILYAAAMGADVINCSWGGPNHSRAEQEVIDYVMKDLGILIVAAAGNEGNSVPYYPASYAGPLSVGATKSDDVMWNTSNFSDRVDLSAPGVQIWSTVIGNKYGIENGTSMATPMVAATAALLLLQDRERTAEELREIIRMTTDNIDLVNQPRLGKFGTGRLNVYRALSESGSVRSARMIDHLVLDDGVDGIIDRGEEVEIRFAIRNILAPADAVSLSLEALDPLGLTIAGSTVELGAMATQEIRNNPDGTMRFTIPADAAPDSRYTFRLTVTADGSTNSELITLDVFPTWRTTLANDITVTFNSVGNIAFNGVDRTQGDGFYYKSRGSLIYHSGLMIGTSAEDLASAVRLGHSSLGTDNGFRFDEPYRIATTAESEIGRARFHDADARLGIDVVLTTYEFVADANAVIARYAITNTTAEPLVDAYCALFVDWDLIVNGQRDQASYDPEYRLGFMRNSTDPTIVAGAALLTAQTPNYFAIDNIQDGITTDFTKETKWTMMSGGIARENTPVDIDASMIVGAGPFTIAPGATDTVAFLLTAGSTIEELRNAVVASRQRLQDLIGSVRPGDITEHLRLDVRPSPLASSGTIAIEMMRSSRLTIELIDLLGRPQGMLFEGYLTEGSHALPIDLSALPAGVYLMRVENGERSGEIRIMHLPE